MLVVSVCMISFNHANFIKQAIESVLAQEGDFLIELLLGDDFSRDNTYEICQTYALKDKRIKLLKSDRNLGATANFKRTLDSCSGDYIAICEGDDYWTDNRKLAKQLEFLKDNPNFGGITHQSDVLIQGVFSRKFKMNVPRTITTLDVLGGRLFHTASVFFRRPAIDLFCKAPIVLSCDRLLNFCISQLGPIYYSEDSMCVYRIHGEGLSSNATVAQMKLDLNSIDYLQSLFVEFPKNRYRSYVYGTIGLCNSAHFYEKIYYLFLSFLFSFSNFPENIRFYFVRIGLLSGNIVCNIRTKIGF